MRQRKWSELSTAQRVAVVVGGALQLALQGWVMRDLRRRKPAEVRGPRWAWAGAALVNPVGPLAYLAVGRRAGQPRRTVGVPRRRAPQRAPAAPGVRR